MSEIMTKEKNKNGKTMSIVKAKDELVALPDCYRTFTSLGINPGISEERLEKLGETIHTMKRKGTLQFWLGDFCIFCEDNNRAHSLLHSFYNYYSDKTIKNIVWICRQVDSTRRRENLSFAHHQVVAPLPPEEQDFWLDAAANTPSYKSLRSDKDSGIWSVKELRFRSKEARLLPEHEEDKGNKSICISTNDNAYSYLGYIDFCNSSVKSLINKIRRLTEFHMHGGFADEVRPERCETKNERSFVKSCARLFWELELLMNEHLSKISIMSEGGLYTRPLVIEDIYTGDPSFHLLSSIVERRFWVKDKELSDVPEIYPHECLFATCRKLAELLNNDVRRLTKTFDKFFESYQNADVSNAESLFKGHVDVFRIICYALILNLNDLFKVINNYVSDPPDEKTVETMVEHLFDSSMEDEEKKSRIKGKVKELLEIIFEE